MSSQWMNKYAIMRDLSLAQGCVPVDVAGTVKAGERPPSQNLIEETEEEFYCNWVGGDGDFSAPDLGLIKHMLNEVRNHDATPVEDIEEGVLEISKLNPLCQEFIPKDFAAGDSPKMKTKVVPDKQKPKRSRNAALQSLLQNIEDGVTAKELEAQNLIKPKDVMKDDETATGKNYSEAVKKVTGWLDTQPVSPETKKSKIKLALDPSSMFKKKNIPEIITPKPVEVKKKTSPHNYGQFVPSDRATTYYKRLVECSKMKEIVQEDVWSKVERQMKEIEERRKAEAELFALSIALCTSHEEPAAAGGTIASSATKQQKLDMIMLPQHRHSLYAKCKVCSIMNKEIKNGDTDCNDNIEENWRTKSIVEEHIKSWTMEDKPTLVLKDKPNVDVIDKPKSNDVKVITNTVDVKDKPNNTAVMIDKINNTVDVKDNIKTFDVKDKLRAIDESSWRAESRSVKDYWNFRNGDYDDDDDEIDSWKTEMQELEKLGAYEALHPVNKEASQQSDNNKIFEEFVAGNVEDWSNYLHYIGENVEKNNGHTTKPLSAEDSKHIAEIEDTKNLVQNRTEGTKAEANSQCELVNDNNESVAESCIFQITKPSKSEVSYTFESQQDDKKDLYEFQILKPKNIPIQKVSDKENIAINNLNICDDDYDKKNVSWLEILDNLSDSDL